MVIIMNRNIFKTTAIAVALTFVAASATITMTDAAYADQGKGNGRGNSERASNGNGNGNGNNGRGAIARELRGLNAAHANQNALLNASPNSMPGKLYIYQQAEIESASAAGQLLTAQTEYDRLIGLTEDEIAAEFPLGGYEDAVTQAAINLSGATTAAEIAAGLANDALLAASGGRTLSDAALNELKSLLGL
jgi:hypothetical protein